MGLYPVPTRGMCQEQFVDLDQLRKHQKSHQKGKATSDPLTHKLKMRKRNGWFLCRVRLDSFASREELFHHRLDHMDDSWAYWPVTPHFDFKDERMNALLCDNAKLIFATIASVQQVLISISHSPFPWNLTGGSMKFIRPLISWLTSMTMKASSSICRWALFWSIKIPATIDFSCLMPITPFSRKPLVLSAQLVG